MSLQGEDSSQIVVVGNDIDSVNLTSLLRKKVGFAELTSVSPVSTEEEKRKQEAKPSEYGVPYYYQPSAPYYAYEVAGYNQNSCIIM